MYYNGEGRLIQLLRSTIAADLLRPQTKQLGRRSWEESCRLLRFHKTFILLSALVVRLLVAALTFAEFHPGASNQSRAAEGFLVSPAPASMGFVMLATMLLFRFRPRISDS